jgi:hypothetical protein
MSSESDFDRLRAEDKRNEVRILWSEIGVVAFVALLVIAYLIVT